MRLPWTLVALLAALAACKPTPQPQPQHDTGAPAPEVRVATLSEGGDSAAFGRPEDIEQAQDAIRRIAALANVFPALMGEAPCPSQGIYPQTLTAMATSTYAPGAKIYQGVAGLEFLQGHLGGSAALARLDAIRCGQGNPGHAGITTEKACDLFVQARASNDGILEWTQSNVVREGAGAPALVIEHVAMNNLGKVVLHTLASPPIAQPACTALSEAKRQAYRCQAEPGQAGCRG